VVHEAGEQRRQGGEGADAEGGPRLGGQHPLGQGIHRAGALQATAQYQHAGNGAHRRMAKALESLGSGDQPGEHAGQQRRAGDHVVAPAPPEEQPHGGGEDGKNGGLVSGHGRNLSECSSYRSLDAYAGVMATGMAVIRTMALMGSTWASELISRLTLTPGSGPSSPGRAPQLWVMDTTPGRILSSGRTRAGTLPCSERMVTGPSGASPRAARSSGFMAAQLVGMRLRTAGTHRAELLLISRTRRTCNWWVKPSRARRSSRWPSARALRNSAKTSSGITSKRPEAPAGAGRTRWPRSWSRPAGCRFTSARGTTESRQRSSKRSSVVGALTMSRGSPR